MTVRKGNRLWEILLVILYVMTLMLLIRDHVDILKIQTELYRNDTEWKYHEWNLPTIEVAGHTQQVQEAYPRYEYAALKYSPKGNYMPIIVRDSMWKIEDRDTCRISIVLGNTEMYSEDVQIKNGVVSLENLESVWLKTRQFYYVYQIRLFLMLFIGIAGLAWILQRHHSSMAEKMKRMINHIKENRRNWYKLGAVFILYMFLCGTVLLNSNYLAGPLVFLPRIEICAYAGALLVLYAVALGMLKSKKNALIVTILAAVPLFFTFHDVTLFQSKDEWNNIKEQLWLSKDVLRHWYFENSKTNYLIMGTIWKMIPSKYTAWGMDPVNLNVFQFSKIIHMCCGFLLSIALIAYILSRLVKKQNLNEKTGSMILLCYMIFTLPVWNTAMDNYNYDLFAVLFCVFGCCLCIDYLATEQLWCKWTSLVCMGVALQEKELVIVYMLIVMTIILANDFIRKYDKQLKNWLYDSLIVFLIPFLPIIFTDVWVLCVLRGGENAINPFAWTVTVLTKSAGLLLEQLGISFTSYAVAILMYFIILFCSIICGITGKYVVKWINRKNRAVTVVILLLMSFLILCAAAIGIKLQQTVGGAETGDGFGSLFVETAYGYVSYVPTIYLLFSSVLLIYLIVKYRKIKLTNREKILGITATVMIGIVTVCNIIAGCLQDLKVLSGRYQNIQQMLNILAWFLLIDIFVKSWKHLMVSAVCTAAFLETVWSAPGYSLFYPIWDTRIYQRDFMIDDDWGVGNGVAGEIIEKYCRENNISFENTHIYSTNMTEWADNNYGIVCQPLKNAVKNNECKLEENDFYVVFSNSITENNVQIVIPKEIAPVLSIKYRGVERIWIYQGNQLRECYPFVQ